MASFLLTAKTDMFLSGNCIVKKGSEFSVHSFDPIANSSNLFNSPERRRNIMSQFAAQGADFNSARKEFMLNGGYWQVQEIRPNRLM